MVETPDNDYQDNDNESQDHQENNLNRDVNSWVEYSSDTEKDQDDNDNDRDQKHAYDRVEYGLVLRL